MRKKNGRTCVALIWLYGLHADNKLYYRTHLLI